MKTNPKSLGNAFEREFSRLLSFWYSNGKDKDIFWHTHGSGARKGIVEQAGDIMAVKEEGHKLMDGLLIECKRTKERDLVLDLVRYPEVKSKINDWWVKLEKEAEELGKDPLLVIKIINKGIICLYQDEYALDLNPGMIVGDRIPMGWNCCMDIEMCSWNEFKERYNHLRMKND